MKAVLFNAQQGHGEMQKVWLWAKAMLHAGHRMTLEAKEATRSTEQNALMWKLLGQISQQVVWHGLRLTDEEWKDVFSASLRKQKVVPGIDGGFVVCGQRTSKMTVAQMSEMIELCMAFGTQHDVKFEAMEYA